MKIPVSARFLAVLLVVNLFLLSLIFLVFFKTRELSTLNLDARRLDYSLPFLPRELVEQINVGSRAFIIYDADARSVILGKNEKLRFAPASTVKIMAALIILEHYNLDQIITAVNIGSVKGSKMGLEEGEQMSVFNLLYGMMLPSGNDAAYVLAQNFAGGQESFVAAMNEKARAFSLTNTKFVDPDGYDNSNYTTAFDLARLAAFAIENPTLAKIVSTRQISVTDASGKIVHNLKNLNELLGIDHVTGIKTGFTDEAGGVLVTSVEKDARRYIIVVLNSSDRFADTKNVIDAVINKIRLLFY